MVNVDMTFPEIFQMIRSQQNMVQDQEKIIKDLDAEDDLSEAKFILSLHPVAS
jgi:hypothetical protein